MSNNRVLAQYLNHLASLGISHLPQVDLTTLLAAESPSARRHLTRLAAMTPQPGASAAGNTAGPRSSSMVLNPADVLYPELLPQVTAVVAKSYATAKEKSHALQQVAAAVAACRRCNELADTRKQTVFGVGNPDARIMFLGEAPGADEDRLGEPFVGAAGQLLDKIIQACRMTREEIYLCNVLRCRPPGNRNPQPQEAANCREFLNAQISIVQPEYIVCWGAVPAQNLLNETRPIGKLRGQFFDHKGSRVICTYHPSYLLRTPSAKKHVWDDMKFLMQDMGIEL